MYLGTTIISTRGVFKISPIEDRVNCHDEVKPSKNINVNITEVLKEAFMC